MNNKDNASPLWDRAEQCRAIAATIHDADLKAEYRKLADAYLKLARHEESLRRRAQ
jgi:hypothetical protein